MKIKTFNTYCQETFDSKVYKLSLSSGCTCPNRDGKISTGGCTFCSMGGSGEFAATGDINSQIEAAKKLVINKLPKNQSKENCKYIAYFQSFSNTYITSDEQRRKLIELYRKVIELPEIVALSLGTRPDCLDEELFAELSRLNKIKPVWIELGLQTASDITAVKINRGYMLNTFLEAYKKLKNDGYTVIAHVIIGLPGETEEDFYKTMELLSTLNPPLDGIKIQLLQVLEGTEIGKRFLMKEEGSVPFDKQTASTMGTDPLKKKETIVKSCNLKNVTEGTDPYEKDEVKIYTLEEYGRILVNCLKKLSPQTVVHRFTGDGPKKLLIEPKWCGDKKRVLNYLNKLIESEF